MPECLWSATFYPEPEAPAYVAELVAAGVEVFKVHVQVGEFHLDDPLLDEVWGMIEDAGTPVVIHAGSGPVGNEFTGPDPLRRVLERHPRLTAVVAHMGAPEYAEFLELAERLRADLPGHDDGVHRLLRRRRAVPRELLPRLADLDGKVLLGSDFPTIPYPYRHPLDALQRLRDREPRLGDDWLRDVCWHNGVALFGPTSTGAD